MHHSGSSNAPVDHNSVRSPLRLGQHWQSLPVTPTDAPVPQVLPSESTFGPFPWFRSVDDMLPFDADCFDER